VAGATRSAGKGVLVVMNDEIDAARDVVKTDSGKTDTFISPSSGLLGIVDPDRVIYYREPYIKEKIFSDVIDEHVDLIKCVSGMDGRFVKASIAAGTKAIVLEAFGRGNIPLGMVPAIEDAIKKGVLVVITSRTHTGRVIPEYGYKGGGNYLVKAGCIMGGDLKGPKMRLKLMALLGKYKDIDRVREYLISEQESMGKVRM
jgi:L-asparaginase